MLNTINGSMVRRVTALVNAAVVLLVFLGVFIGVNWPHMSGGLAGFLGMRITIKNLLIAVICLVGGALTFHLFGLTKPSRDVVFRSELVRVTKACTVAAVFPFLFPLTSQTGSFRFRILLYFLPTAILACLAGRLAAHTFAQRFARTLTGHRDLIIVGTGPRAARIYDQLLETSDSEFRVIGFVDSPDRRLVTEQIRRRTIGNLEELEYILVSRPVDEVLIALPAESCHAQIQTAITTCERVGVEAKYLLSDMFELSLARPRFEPDESVLSLKVVHDDARLLVKRAIDILGALVGLALLGPIMLAVAGIIRLTSPGPALFVQERYGWHKRRFRMYKFRTMVQDAERLQASLEQRNEVNGPAFKIRNDPRITSIGRFLRKTSIDELPQFFNVLKGEMSLVGPRPLPGRDVSRFDNAALMRRFSVKPGLTCLWQICGRSDTDFSRWIALDLKYIDEWSLALDLRILLQTVPAVLVGRGAV